MVETLGGGYVLCRRSALSLPGLLDGPPRQLRCCKTLRPLSPLGV